MDNRQTSKFNHRELSLVLALWENHDWLDSKQRRVLELLSDCISEEEQNLLISLLDRYTYLNFEEFQNSLRNIVDYIIGGDNNEEETLVAPLANDPEVDSSHYLAYFFKVGFREKSWVKIKPFIRPASIIKRAHERPNIFVVDEFVGTGKTAINRLEHLENALNVDRVENYSITMCTIAGMANGLSEIEAAGFRTYAVHVLDKGISDHFADVDLAEALAQMVRLESILMSKIDDFELDTLGFKKSESLFGRDGGIVPNNVFPIFWWRKYSDGSGRNPLLLGPV